jgi:hypothetical protein
MATNDDPFERFDGDKAIVGFAAISIGFESIQNRALDFGRGYTTD